MDRRICIVTGANSGIGKQAAFQLAEENFHVILLCRSRDRGKAALDELIGLVPGASAELAVADMSVLASVRTFAEDFNRRYDRLDVLIHNAAIFNVTQKSRELTAEGIETVWAANHLGPVLLTELLLARLRKSKNGRILTVSSKGLKAKPFLRVDLKDPEFKEKKYSVVNAYYQSKLAQIMYTYWMADRLHDTGVTVNNIRVPAVRIDISRHPELSGFMKWVYAQKAKNSITPEKMAETYTYLATSDKVTGISGKCFDESNSPVSTGRYTGNPENIEAVMKLTSTSLDEIKLG